MIDFHDEDNKHDHVFVIADNDDEDEDDALGDVCYACISTCIHI